MSVIIKGTGKTSLLDNDNNIYWYTCGPTVYDHSHIGHARTYVTNDILLGSDNKDGILLFGTNACGKSTLMKAVGLNVVLAQAGLFVAASSFKFTPYTQIFTRILNNDNKI